MTRKKILPNQFFFLQDSEADQTKTKVLYENTLPCTSATKQEQGGSDSNDKCIVEIPMVAFSSSNQDDDDQCDEDCDSFDSSDLLKFAWQIARGMVSIPCNDNRANMFFTPGVNCMFIHELLRIYICLFTCCGSVVSASCCPVELDVFFNFLLAIVL